jgi:hypothetical protein
MAYWPFPKLRGPVAQLGERVNRTHEARGSNPLGSTFLNFQPVVASIAHPWRQPGEISAEIPALWRQTASSIPANDPAAHRVEGQDHQIVALVATPSLDGYRAGQTSHELQVVKE